MRIIVAIAQRRVILAIALVFVVYPLSIDAGAQSPAEERADSLRQQLAETRSKQESLEARLRQLNDEIKPESIEKSLAGIGSTHPEDLREYRRRQLDLEKMTIQTQLKLLADSQTRLEASILQADTNAYHQSAGVNAEGIRHESAGSRPITSSSVQRRRRPTNNTPKRQRIRRQIQD
jgi:hypothetical protein